MSENKKIAALIREMTANADHRTGYRPDIHYTKLMPSGQIYYFDQDGKHIGSGTVHDKVWFQWIPSEDMRKEPDQIVDPERFHQMVLDTEPLYINIPEGHAKSKSKKDNKPKAEEPKEPKSEEPKSDEPKADEPKTDAPAAPGAPASPTKPPAPASKPADPAKPEAKPEEKKDEGKKENPFAKKDDDKFKKESSFTAQLKAFLTK